MRLRHLAAMTAAVAALAPAQAPPATTAPAAAHDWPQWRGPGRDGISRETGWTTDWPAAGPKELWRAAVGEGYSSVSVAAGRLYTMGHLGGGNDAVHCLDAATGKEIWKHTYPCRRGRPQWPGPRSTPTVHDGLVHTLSAEGDLFCLDAAAGKVLWSHQLRTAHGAERVDYGAACSPLVLGDRLIVQMGRVFAFDRKTGRLIWKTAQYTPGYGSPMAFSLKGATYLAVFNGLGLVILEAVGGGQVAAHEWPTPYDMNCCTPVISGDRIFIASTRSARGGPRGGALFQFRPGEGLKVVYEKPEMDNHCSTCVLWEGRLYGFAGRVEGGGTLICMDFDTGKTRWSEDLGTGYIQLTAGRLVMLTSDGALTVAEATPEKYKPLASARVLTGQCWTRPVLAGGRIYCRNTEGTLICLDVRASS